jgi:multicomponent Na+:H+ antiporter subunit C
MIMIVTLITAALLAVTGAYCVVVKKNLLKKLIGLGIFTNFIHLAFISMGYMEGGIAPIMTPENVLSFPVRAVDPIPQALVLTSIVVQLSVTALALSITILAYRHFKTLDTDKMRELNG